MPARQMFLAYTEAKLCTQLKQNRYKCYFILQKKKIPEPGPGSLFAAAKLRLISLSSPDPAEASGSATAVVSHTLIPGYL